MNDHKESTMTDPINPDYYDAGGRQLIDLLEGMQFSRGSAVKYLVRAGHKNPATELEDLRKAAWYINREIARLEGENRD